MGETAIRTGPIVASQNRVPLGGCSSQSGGTITICPFFPHVKSSFLPQPRRTLQKPHSKPSLPVTAFFTRTLKVARPESSTTEENARWSRQIRMRSVRARIEAQKAKSEQGR